MDVETPILSGYLIVSTQSGFPLNRISKKKPCQKYCLLFKSSRHGIERLEICESKDDKNPKIVTLENCVKITQEPSPVNLICIVKKTGTLTLNTLSEEDLKEWINALRTVAFRDKNELHLPHVAIEEDNDLYCSSFSDGFFMVTLIPSKTSIRCNIEPKIYMLHLSATELQLKSAEDFNNTIANWPYRFIRKYGYRDGKFTFEAGRKCSTGEGVFTLYHTNPQEVFRCMSSKMKSMKKLINGDMFINKEGVENQLNIAASMGPGSRSPLPHSPSNQHSDFDMNSTQSSVSMRGFISSTDSLNNITNSSAMPLAKIIPNKLSWKHSIVPDKLISTSIHPLEKNYTPKHGDKFRNLKGYGPGTNSNDPNKTVGSTVILKSISPDIYREDNTITVQNLHERNVSDADFGNEQDYEIIETIKDAWKTLGINDVKHTERFPGVNNNDLLDLVMQQSNSHDKIQQKEYLSVIETSKIIDIDIGESNSNITSLSTDMMYDRLNFLTANNKTLNGYKTILAVTPAINQSRCVSPPQNEYEMIDLQDIQSCRKGNPLIHLDYGIHRKSSELSERVHAFHNSVPVPDTASAKVSDEPMFDHSNCNGFNYTIVSKPKRV